MVLCEDGRHVWLGRASEPSNEEVTLAERRLTAQNLAGWLSVAEGDYYGTTRMSLLEIRKLGAPASSWDAAVDRFNEARNRVTSDA